MGIDGRAADEVEEVKKENVNESSLKDEIKPETQDVKDKEKERPEEPQYCKDCCSYDHSTERQFKRNGIRLGLVETRAMCRNPKAKSFDHIVMAELARPKRRRCNVWEAGVYIKPEVEKSRKQKEQKNEEKTSPSEYHGPPLTDVEKTELKQNKKKRSKRPRLKRGDKVIVTDPQNGETKTFEKIGRKLILVKQ